MSDDLIARAERAKQDVLQWRAKFGGGMHPGKPAQAAADMIDELLAIIAQVKRNGQVHVQQQLEVVRRALALVDAAGADMEV